MRVIKMISLPVFVVFALLVLVLFGTSLNEVKDALEAVVLVLMPIVGVCLIPFIIDGK